MFLAALFHEPDEAPHVADDTLELYVVGRLAGFGRTHRHIQWCARCRKRAAELSDGTEMLAESLSRLNPLFRHLTSDGAIAAHVRRARDGSYVARLIGPSLDCGQRCASYEQAADWCATCATAFRDMFPEHSCGRKCG